MNKSTNLEQNSSQFSRKMGGSLAFLKVLLNDYFFLMLFFCGIISSSSNFFLCVSELRRILFLAFSEMRLRALVANAEQISEDRPRGSSASLHEMRTQPCCVNLQSRQSHFIRVYWKIYQEEISIIKFYFLLQYFSTWTFFVSGMFYMGFLLWNIFSWDIFRHILF